MGVKMPKFSKLARYTGLYILSMVYRLCRYINCRIAPYHKNFLQKGNCIDCIMFADVIYFLTPENKYVSETKYLKYINKMLKF